MADFEDILTASSQLGGEVDKALAPAREWLDRAATLNEQLAAAREREEREYAKQIEVTAKSGRLPSPNGFHWGFDSPASKMVVASVAACHNNAAGAGRAAASALFAALQKRVASVVAEAVTLTATLPPEVVGERSAMRAGNDARHFRTWQKLGELLAVWESSHELNRLLWRAAWIAGPSHVRDRAGAHVFVAYGKPHQLATIPRGTPRERHLAAAQAAGAQPGLYSWVDATARWERLDRRQRPYVHMEVVQQFDSRGNLVRESKSAPVASEFVPAER